LIIHQRSLPETGFLLAAEDGGTVYSLAADAAGDWLLFGRRPDEVPVPDVVPQQLVASDRRDRDLAQLLIESDSS
jgi:hypothetical protein